MKTLANCTPREFFAQTNKIRKVAKDWMDKTKVLDIRLRAPEFKPEITLAEKMAAIRKQVRQNTYDMIGAAIEEYPDETIELLCHVCFIDPKDADKHSMSEFLGVIADILADDNVIGFFTSLASLGLSATSDSADK